MKNIKLYEIIIGGIIGLFICVFVSLIILNKSNDELINAQSDYINSLEKSHDYWYNKYDSISNKYDSLRFGIIRHKK